MASAAIKEISQVVSQILEGCTYFDRCHVWRGQADSNWEAYPSLYRRLKNHGGYTDCQITEELVQRYENDLLCESNGIGYYSEAGGNRLSLMINLQHEGGATRFLDVTRDPFVALWFACYGGDDDTDAAVFHYEIDPRCHAHPETVLSWDSLFTDDTGGTPVLFSPKRINEKIKPQGGLFLTTALTKPLSAGSIFTETSTWISKVKTVVPAHLKRYIRSYLENDRCMRIFDIYPDFAGFAKAHSVQAPFRRTREKLYPSTESQGFFPDSFEGPTATVPS